MPDRPAPSSSAPAAPSASADTRPAPGLVADVADIAGAAQAALAGPAGAVLAGVTQVVGALTRGIKPLHPTGVVGAGELTITAPPSGERTGVPLFDTPATHEVTLRWSRATGRPADGHDVDGLALRVHGEQGGDWLLASTGTGALTRYTLQTRTGSDPGPMTTLLPLSTPNGSLLLALTPRDDAHPPRAFDVAVAHALGPWRTCGTLICDWAPTDELITFDPVGHTSPGVRQYPVVTGVRAPAYLLARWVRRQPR